MPSRSGSGRRGELPDEGVPVKIGVCSANSGPYATRDLLAELARVAESVGIESIWVSDHVVMPDPRRPPSRMGPEDPILDPVAALAFLAGRTESARLGSGVIVLPLREPVVLAKQLATVDVLSGGRLIVGVGVGYVDAEFEAIGVPFEGRGLRTEEYVAAMRALWRDERPAFDGDLVSFGGVQARPRPLQHPAPPVVMGGYAPAVMRRTVGEADGWYGWGLDLDATADRLRILRETASRVQRRNGLRPLEITITPPDTVTAQTALRYADLGVDRLNLQLPWIATTADLARFFEQEVVPVLDAVRSTPTGPITRRMS
jgi:probable F420-dependent oxidoreductase